MDEKLKHLTRPDRQGLVEIQQLVYHIGMQQGATEKRKSNVPYSIVYKEQ